MAEEINKTVDSAETIEVVMTGEEIAPDAQQILTDAASPEILSIEINPTFLTDEHGKTQCLVCQQILPTKEEFDQHYLSVHPVEKPEEKKEEIVPVKADTDRNEKGQFAPGNNASHGAGGSTCDFCKRPVEIIQKIKLYGQWTRGKVDGKIHVPFLEELCDEDYLDIDEDTLTNWTLHAHDQERHAELIGAIKTLMMRQKGFLKKRVLGDKNPTGGIFLLKANHGMVEAEKKILVGEKSSDPINFIFTEERKLPDDE